MATEEELNIQKEQSEAQKTLNEAQKEGNTLLTFFFNKV